ncbi:MAG TPA: hypothetical protein VJJ55_00510, partial [Candidatus Paceibacterota bacterium]
MLVSKAVQVFVTAYNTLIILNSFIHNSSLMESAPNNASAKIISALIIGLIVGFIAGAFWQERRSGAVLETTAAKQTGTTEKKTEVTVDAATASAQSAQIKVNEKSQSAAAVAAVTAMPSSAFPAEIAVAEQAAGSTVAIALLE